MIEEYSAMGLLARIFGALLVLGLLFGGLHYVTQGTQSQLTSGTIMLVIAVILLFATVRLWAPWFFGACGVNSFRFLVGMALGRTWSPPSMVAPRLFCAEMALILAMMTVLTYRFANNKPTWLDSIALVGALTGLVYSVLSPAPLRWVLLALALLGAAFVCSYLLTPRAKLQIASETKRR